MASSSDESNQLEPIAAHSVSHDTAKTIDARPATVDVRAGAAVISDIGDNQITAHAERIRYSTDETMVWQESPSMALLFPRAVRYLVYLAIVFILCSVVGNVIPTIPIAKAALEQNGIQTSSTLSRSQELFGDSAPKKRSTRKPHSGHRTTTDEDTSTTTSADDSSSSTLGLSGNDPASPTSGTKKWTLSRILFLVKLGFTLLYMVLFFFYFLSLKSTKYSASSQRLIVEEGTLSGVNRPYELHQLGDAVIVKPILLRLFNVSNLVITKPHIELIGLRNAAYVRDVLRQGGQLEAQRTDKIRFR